MALNTNKTKHKFADECIRNQLPRFVNSAPQNVINKVLTHSLAGFMKYAKIVFIDGYEDSCFATNCYVCNHWFNLVSEMPLM